MWLQHPDKSITRNCIARSRLDDGLISSKMARAFVSSAKVRYVVCLQDTLSEVVNRGKEIRTMSLFNTESLAQHKNEMACCIVNLIRPYDIAASKAFQQCAEAKEAFREYEYVAKQLEAMHTTLISETNETWLSLHTHWQSWAWLSLHMSIAALGARQQWTTICHTGTDKPFEISMVFERLLDPTVNNYFGCPVVATPTLNTNFFFPGLAQGEKNEISLDECYTHKLFLNEHKKFAAAGLQLYDLVAVTSAESALYDRLHKEIKLATSIMGNYPKYFAVELCNDKIKETAVMHLNSDYQKENNHMKQAIDSMHRIVKDCFTNLALAHTEPVATWMCCLHRGEEPNDTLGTTAAECVEDIGVALVDLYPDETDNTMQVMKPIHDYITMVQP